MVVFGQLVATIICGLFAEVKEGWRYMLGKLINGKYHMSQVLKVIL